MIKYMHLPLSDDMYFYWNGLKTRKFLFKAEFLKAYEKWENNTINMAET